MSSVSFMFRFHYLRLITLAPRRPPLILKSSMTSSPPSTFLRRLSCHIPPSVQPLRVSLIAEAAMVAVITPTRPHFWSRSLSWGSNAGSYAVLSTVFCARSNALQRCTRTLPCETVGQGPSRVGPLSPDRKHHNCLFPFPMSHLAEHSPCNAIPRQTMSCVCRSGFAPFCASA